MSKSKEMLLRFTLVLLNFILIDYNSYGSIDGLVSNAIIEDVIDEGDSIIFNVAQASIENGIISIPMSIVSDELIEAVDFNMKLDTNVLKYKDVEVVHMGNFSFNSFFNPDDNTLRFTSNDLTPIPNDGSVILYIRFELLSNELLISQLSDVNTFLNGDICSAGIYGEDLSLNTDNIELDFKIYPNPAKDILQIDTEQNLIGQILNTDGTLILEKVVLSNRSINTIDISNYPEGQYLFQFTNLRGQSFSKIFMKL